LPPVMVTPTRSPLTSPTRCASSAAAAHAPDGSATVLRRSNRNRMASTISASDAMRFLFERLKTVAEPSGACAAAALLAGRVGDVSGLRVGVTITGGNVTAERFAALISG